MAQRRLSTPGADRRWLVRKIGVGVSGSWAGANTGAAPAWLAVSGASRRGTAPQIFGSSPICGTLQRIVFGRVSDGVGARRDPNASCELPTQLRTGERDETLRLVGRHVKLRTSCDDRRRWQRRHFFLRGERCNAGQADHTTSIPHPGNCVPVRSDGAISRPAVRGPFS